MILEFQIFIHCIILILNNGFYLFDRSQIFNLISIKWLLSLSTIFQKPELLFALRLDPHLLYHRSCFLVEGHLLTLVLSLPDGVLRFVFSDGSANRVGIYLSLGDSRHECLAPDHSITRVLLLYIRYDIFYHLVHVGLRLRLWF